MGFSFRETMFRAWYRYLSTVDKNADVIFMNYGYDDENEVVQMGEAHDLNRYSIQLYHQLAKSVEIKDKDILEIGCGRGGGLSYVTHVFEPATAMGVDLDPRAMDFCNRHYKQAGLTFQQGDAQNLQLESNSYDVVLNVESSHRYQDMAAFLNEVIRILRPGGYFLFTDFRYDYDHEAMKKSLQMSGLKILSEKNINNEVTRALDLDTERRSNLVKKLIPRFLHKSARSFAGVPGSETYTMIADRRYIYFSYILQKV